ncbi:hypothetical protein GCM10011344_21110 [Dokdonia pacifica]|uniref:Uncharacterized protein n=1 Tax=Dokdonia pacifica TaxID=1627892 RepID=A0A238VM53_9FLAO|nr:hypothetical protein [Dokdonia pacifica]GGG20231.1 hypothetical protein GCM10011344_21110 [Dokdonia pacifica]SNR35278.1 hypothetical protein SAMN06265376_10121 [Dokdonia pacifica]
MKYLIFPLVNWVMGAIVIGIFAIVCIVMALVVYNLATGDKKTEKNQREN